MRRYQSKSASIIHLYWDRDGDRESDGEWTISAVGISPTALTQNNFVS